MPQPRPDGVEWDITDEWLKWFENRLAETGMSQRELADKIVEIGSQATGASISDIRTGKVRRSRLVPAINAVLGGPVPTQHIVESDAEAVHQRVNEKLSQLDESGQLLILQLIDRLLTRNRGGNSPSGTK